MSQILNIHGQTVKLPRPVRHYAVVSVRAVAHTTDAGVYVPYAYLIGQSDSLTTARRKQAAHDPGPAAEVLILDTTTGMPAGDPDRQAAHLAKYPGISNIIDPSTGRVLEDWELVGVPPSPTA